MSEELWRVGPSDSVALVHGELTVYAPDGEKFRVDEPDAQRLVDRLNKHDAAIDGFERRISALEKLCYCDDLGTYIVPNPGCPVHGIGSA
jgi:hypothetical protein